ncbi:hypothetical protein [Phytobacter sp. V91]|uniref:hypothetical protein n=1 Tax=Phytobacter sp. V91 TaxID=3369425 RepID=UPI003F5D72E3
MIGVEFGKIPAGLQATLGEYYSAMIAGNMVENYRVQVNFTINNLAVFRFLPPLIISDEELEYGLNAFEASVELVVKTVAEAQVSA